MLEEATGPGRRFHAAPLEHPFGRGVNFQIETSDVNALYADVRRSDLTISLPLEERWYRHDQIEWAIDSSSWPIPTATCCGSSAVSAADRRARHRSLPHRGDRSSAAWTTARAF